MSRVGLIAAVGLLCWACAPTSHAVDAPPDVLVIPRADAPLADCASTISARDVGVLFVLQSSGPTEGPRGQAALAVEELFPLLRGVTSGILRFAAITGDAGPGGLVGAGCSIAGRDGVFLEGTLGTPSSGPILSLAPTDSMDGFVADARALLDDAGNDACVNQALESVARAITPSTVPLELPAHGHLHGDRENAGLVQSRDILLVVFITDAEDCSWNEGVTASLPDGLVGCAESPSERCCPEVLYPAADRYVSAYRRAASALGVSLAFSLISGIPEADVSLAEWRARAEPDLCVFPTPSVYAGMPWRILEALDYFEPFVTTQPRCDPNYQAIADVVRALACATDG